MGVYKTELKFNGKMYHTGHQGNMFRTKAIAQSYAKKLRKGGRELARVVKQDDRWFVYHRWK